MHIFYLVDCEWSEWQNVSKCNSRCGRGKQWQQREITKKEKYGGTCDGKVMRAINCESKERCLGKYLPNCFEQITSANIKTPRHTMLMINFLIFLLAETWIIYSCVGSGTLLLLVACIVTFLYFRRKNNEGKPRGHILLPNPCILIMI